MRPADFGFTTTYADLNATGSCTSCEVTQDHSAYWTPSLHFMFDNGTTVMVEQVGGMLAYYLYYLQNITAFPEGFQMVAGNRNIRHFDGPFPDTPLSSWPTDPTNQLFLEQRAIGFNCLNYQKDPEPSLYRHVLPSKDQLDNDCVDGIRLELAFPSCGTGQTDSPDHKSHVAYPSLVKEGNCPDGYDVNYPFLFYETIWNTYQFASASGQFVLSYGDPTGAGYHGDFIMGWQSQQFLQSALDTCQAQSGEISDCPLFDIQSDADAAKCTFDMPDALKDDDVQGPRDGLPVSVPVQYGPQNATAYPCVGRSGSPSSYVAQTAAPETFSHGPTVSYTPADPAVTSTALGGIVVDQYSAHAAPTAQPGTLVPQALKEQSPQSAVVSPLPSAWPPTSSPSPTLPPSPSTSSSANVVAVTTYTTGHEVVEMYIVETDVTVTATATATVTEGAQSRRRRRHLDYHLHGARR